MTTRNLRRQRAGISRRESLRRAALLAGASGLPFSYAAASEQGAVIETAAAPWHFPSVPAVKAPGYGPDPQLVHPAPVPWPTTLGKTELELVAVLADILIPAEGATPSASAVGVPEVIDEWVSAPYPDQQQHRMMLLAGLDWFDREAQRRFRRRFVEADEQDQLVIVDDVAFPARSEVDRFAEPRAFFELFRQLVVGIFYTSPEGVRELGYQGNVPISGDYPGPTGEAMAHLRAQLARLDLEL